MYGNSYFERHWRGELSLGVSCWINHVLVGGAALWLAAAGAAAIARRTQAEPLPCCCFIIAVFILLGGLQLWQVTGTWRAAVRARRRGRGGAAMAAQAMVCLSALGMALPPFATLQPLVQAVGTARPGVQDPTQGPAEAGAVLTVAGDVLIFSGPIDGDSPAAFKRLLDAAQPRRVRLNSYGGLVVPARAMAAMIRASGLDTEVEGHCASACTIVFFAGRRRTLAGGGVLGFHGYSATAGTQELVLEQEDRDRRVFVAGGVTPAFVDRMFAVPPEQVWFPTRDEVQAAGFVSAD